MNKLLSDMLTVLEEGNPGQPTEEILMLYEDWCEGDSESLKEIEEIRESIEDGGFDG